MRRLIAIVLVSTALVGSARAADLTAVAELGYATSTVYTGGTCPSSEQVAWTATATGFGTFANFGSVCDPGYSAIIDAFIAGHPERKLRYQQPAAVSARDSLIAKGYTVTTGYEPPSFAVAGGCSVDSTVDAAGVVALDQSLPAAAPCPAPPPAQAPAPAGPTIDERVTALEQEVAELKPKVASLEAAQVASWNAWVDSLAAGLPPYEAALAARSAGMNALYGLG